MLRGVMMTSEVFPPFAPPPPNLMTGTLSKLSQRDPPRRASQALIPRALLHTNGRNKATSTQTRSDQPKVIGQSNGRGQSTSRPPPPPPPGRPKTQAHACTHRVACADENTDVAGLHDRSVVRVYSRAAPPSLAYRALNPALVAGGTWCIVILERGTDDGHKGRFHGSRFLCCLCTVRRSDFLACVGVRVWWVSRVFAEQTPGSTCFASWWRRRGA